MRLQSLLNPYKNFELAMKEANLPPLRGAYINVMESLVAEEVGQQLQDVPARVRRYLKLEEVVTYALNRLPALYASSEKGWQYQRQLAKQKLHHKIRDAVRQAILAVQVDPIRLSQPLQLVDNPEAEAVLQALRSFFHIPDLDWAKALKQLSTLQLEDLVPAGSESPAIPHTTWRPGTYGRQVSWQGQRTQNLARSQANSAATSRDPRHARPEQGWEDARYCM